MSDSGTRSIADFLAAHEEELRDSWLESMKRSGALESGRVREAELQTQCTAFLRELRSGLQTGGTDIGNFSGVTELLSDLSRSRAIQGFSPRETALFVFSLKQPLLDAVGGQAALSADGALRPVWMLLDELGLYTFEVFQKSREEVIVRQQEEISELSTPVIKLWKGILALPLIGTLDSQRTQVVMENLLEAIVDQGASIAIIDITGVPTVDTLTAQHLLKTVAAARLMGADCIISGIRPQIAQTMVHLGVELSVVSKATLADALALALSRLGRAVVRVSQPAAGAGS